MPKIVNNIEDLSDRVKEYIKKACETGIILYFTQYDKRSKVENGKAVIQIRIDPKDFDYDYTRIAEHLIKERKKYMRSNRSYKTENNDQVKTLTEPRIIKCGIIKYGIEQQEYIRIYNPESGASTLAIIGSSQTGKSTLWAHIYNLFYDNNKYCSILYTVSPEMKVLGKINKEYLIIRNNFNHEDENTIEMQKYINDEKNNKYNFLNIFDDIVDNKYSKTVDKLCLVYRNSMISTIISTQYPFLISKKNRSNINSFALFKFHQFNFIEEMIKTYLKPLFIDILGKDATMDQMIELYQEATKDHGFIYYSPFEAKLQFIKLAI